MQATFVTLDGDMRGYLALPEAASPVPAVLVYMEAFGLNTYVQSECRRLAAHGFAALAPDFYRGVTLSYGDRPAVMAKLQQLKDEQLLADVRSAITYLDRREDVRHERYGVVGFCMGGRLAFLTAAEFPERIGAAVSFYGSIAPDPVRFFPPLADRVPDICAPLMLIYGADDESIAPSEHARLAKALSEQKKAYTLSVYPGARHGFASADRDVYNEKAAEDAWARVMGFLGRLGA